MRANPWNHLPHPALWIVRTSDGEPIATPDWGWHSGVFSPSGKALAFCDFDKIQIVDSQTGNLIGDFSRQINEREGVQDVFFSPEGDLFAVLYADSGEAVFVRNLKSGEETLRRTFWNAAAWRRRDIHPFLPVICSRLTAKETELGTFVFWDLTTGQMINNEVSISHPHSRWLPITATPDGRYIAFFMETSVSLSDLNTGRTWTVPFAKGWQGFPKGGDARGAPCYAGSLSADGRTLVVSLCDSPPPQRFWFYKPLAWLGIDLAEGWHLQYGIALYDTATGEELGYFPEAEFGTLSYDGRTLALANGKGQIELWDWPPRPTKLIFVLLASAVAILTLAVLSYWKRPKPVSPSSCDAPLSPAPASAST
jgi:WD40 repeat protein